MKKTIICILILSLLIIGCSNNNVCNGTCKEIYDCKTKQNILYNEQIITEHAYTNCLLENNNKK